MRDLDREAERRDAVKDLRRLSKIILEDMQQGLQNRTVDPKEMRLLGATAVRSIRLYLKTLDEGSKPEDRATDDSGTVRATSREDQNKSGKD